MINGVMVFIIYSVIIAERNGIVPVKYIIFAALQHLFGTELTNVMSIVIVIEKINLSFCIKGIHSLCK